jgi:hypothetical protein
VKQVVSFEAQSLHRLGKFKIECSPADQTARSLPFLMSRVSQIESLRREHGIACRKFDFDRAQLIEKQIQRLQSERSRDFEVSVVDTAALQIEEQRDKILGDSARGNAVYTEKKLEIQRIFHRRFQQLKERHTQEQTDLSREQTMQLESRLRRTNPEVATLEREATLLGHQHRYADARTVYKNAERVRSTVTQERRDQCEAAFLKSQNRLKSRQQREEDLLVEKQQAAIRALDQQLADYSSSVANQMKVKEFKASRLRVGQTPSGRVSQASARRSRSVSRAGSARKDSSFND